MLSGEDYDAELAERYGWINRALPADALGDFVSSLAHRIAGFPAAGHVVVKDRVNAITLAPVEDFRRDSDLFDEGVRNPGFRAGPSPSSTTASRLETRKSTCRGCWAIHKATFGRDRRWIDANSWPGRPHRPRRWPQAPHRHKMPIPPAPSRLINPFPPGRAADVVGRPFAAALEPIIKQPVVIDTKAGAAGAVGAQFAASAKPDGYTLLVHIVSISGFAEMDKLFGRQPKFTRADFIPIARFTEGPMVLVVNDQTPYKT